MATVNSTSTISALRLVTGASNGDAYEVLGYWAARDGGGGVYVCDTSDTTSADNGGSIIKAADNKRWKLQNTNAMSVRQFGAKGDDSTDDLGSIVAAITAVGSGTLVWPPGTYKVALTGLTTTLTMPTSQSWQGQGGRRAATIKKYGNGDLVTMGDLTSISDLNLECQGSSHNGRGIYVNNGFSHQIHRVRINAAQGVALEFNNNVGGGANVSALEANTTAPDSVPALKVRDTTACPRFFYGIWLAGGQADFQSGGNGNSFTNFYIKNILTDTSTALLHVSNGRLATVGEIMTIKGTDITISNVAFAGLVEFQSAQGVKLVSSTLASGFTEDSTNCQYNEIYDQRKAYTLTWDQTTTPQPNIGNGTNTSSYQRSGYQCAVSVRLVMGSATTYGNSTSAYRFSLPFNGHQAVDQRALPAQVIIGSTTYQCSATIGANEGWFTLAYNGQSVRLGYPAEFTTGATIDVEFSYMAR